MRITGVYSTNRLPAPTDVVQINGKKPGGIPTFEGFNTGGSSTGDRQPGGGQQQNRQSSPGFGSDTDNARRAIEEGKQQADSETEALKKGVQLVGAMFGAIAVSKPPDARADSMASANQRNGVNQPRPVTTADLSASAGDFAAQDIISSQLDQDPWGGNQRVLGSLAGASLGANQAADEAANLLPSNTGNAPNPMASGNDQSTQQRDINNAATLSAGEVARRSDAIDEAANQAANEAANAINSGGDPKITKFYCENGSTSCQANIGESIKLIIEYESPSSYDLKWTVYGYTIGSPEANGVVSNPAPTGKIEAPVNCVCTGSGSQCSSTTTSRMTASLSRNSSNAGRSSQASLELTCSPGAGQIIDNIIRDEVIPRLNLPRLPF